MNGLRLALHQLQPAEAAAVPVLEQFAAEHAGVTIVTPHYHDEPWRAELREGAVPGEPRATSGVLVSRSPSGLLAKLEAEFASDQPDTG